MVWYSSEARRMSWAAHLVCTPKETAELGHRSQTAAAVAYNLAVARMNSMLRMVRKDLRLG